MTLEGRMRINRIENHNMTGFGTLKKPGSVPNYVIKLYELNMEKMIGYKGPKSYTPPPENISAGVKRYFDMLKINWDTHVTSKKA